jgi:hypothetical protein
MLGSGGRWTAKTNTIPATKRVGASTHLCENSHHITAETKHSLQHRGQLVRGQTLKQSHSLLFALVVQAHQRCHLDRNGDLSYARKIRTTLL